MAAVTPNGLLCAVCCDPIGGDGGEVEALTCGHVFHSYCIHRFAQVHHLQLEELPCPLCKQTAGSQVPVIEIHPDALQLQGLLWPPAAGDPQADVAGEAPQAPQADVAFPPPGDVAGEAPQAPAAEAPQAPAAGEVPQAPAEAPQAPAAGEAHQAPAADAWQEGLVLNEVQLNEGLGNLHLSSLNPGAVARAAEVQDGVQAEVQATVAPPPRQMQLSKTASVQDVGRFPDPVVTCSSCGGIATLSKMRLCSKIKGTWECQTCMTKTSQLRRDFGKWPTDNFIALSLEEQKSFHGRYRWPEGYPSDPSSYRAQVPEDYAAWILL
jgi:hypothetical protein